MAKSILCDNENPSCFLTGRKIDLDKHHVMNGSLRKWAEHEGLWVYLHHDVHMRLHYTGEGKKMMLKLKKLAQETWEEIHKDDYEDVHAEWMKKVRKNYV